MSSPNTQALFDQYDSATPNYQFAQPSSRGPSIAVAADPEGLNRSSTKVPPSPFRGGADRSTAAAAPTRDNNITLPQASSMYNRAPPQSPPRRRAGDEETSTVLPPRGPPAAVASEVKKEDPLTVGSSILDQAADIKLRHFDNPEVVALTQVLGSDPEALALALIEWANEQQQASSAPRATDTDSIEDYDSHQLKGYSRVIASTPKRSPPRPLPPSRGEVVIEDSYLQKGGGGRSFVSEDTSRLGLSVVRRATVSSPSRNQLNTTTYSRSSNSIGPTTSTNSLLGTVPSLQQHQLNPLQREVLALGLNGKNIIMTSGRRSGRCTCTALICDRLIDPTVPPSLSMPIVILCGIHQEKRLAALLAEPISTNRVFLMTDLQYRQRPLDVVRGPPGGVNNNSITSANSSRRQEPLPAASAPLFIVVGNAAHLDAFCAADALSRFQDRPQVIALLDEPFKALEEALMNVSKSFAYAPWNFSRLGIKTTFRDVVNQLEGSGHVIVPRSEEKKYSGLVDLASQLFDYSTFLVVVSSRRKAEKLSGVFSRYMDCNVIHHRSPKTIEDANDDFMEASRYNLCLLEEQPYGPRTNMIKKKNCLICDALSIPLLSPEVTSKLQAVVYYDCPDSVTQIPSWSDTYFTPVDGGIATKPCLQVVFAADDREYKALKGKTGLRFVTVDI